MKALRSALPLLVFAVFCRPAWAQDSAQTRPPAAAARRDSTAQPAVVVGGDTIIVVRTRIGSFPPAERATAIQRRLTELSQSGRFRPEQLQLNAGETATDIAYEDRVLLTITDADATAAQTTRAELASSVLTTIRQALNRESLAARLRTLAFSIGSALLALVVFLLMLWLINRFFKRGMRAVSAGRMRIPALRLQKQVLFSTEQLAAALLWLLRALRVVLLLLVLILTLPVILKFFPWTHSWGDRLLGLVLTPLGQILSAFAAYVPNLFTMGVIGVCTWFLLKVIRLVFDGLEHGRVTIPGFYAEWADPTYKLVRALVLAFTLIMIWPYLPGSDSPAFKGVGVMLGLLISFGSASAIGNLVGGVVLTYMRPFKVGDRVKIADTVGDVTERTLLVTRVRTIKNVSITVPNAMVLANHIVNYSARAAEAGLILHTTVTIGYDAPWRQVHDLLIAAAQATDGLLHDPAPFVLQTSLDDFYVSYELNAYTDLPNQMAVIYSQLHANIQDSFNRAGVEIMSPHYRAARDGNAIAIPDEYKPAGYSAPGFRFEKS